MKKKLYLLSMLAAGLTLAGCNDDLGDGPGNEVLSGDKGYVKIAINLPTTSGQVTRSENDDFYDGSANEYKVNSVNLILFSGLSESKATFLERHDLTDELKDQFSLIGSSTDDITTSALITKQVTVPESGDLYGLVVLNGTVADASGGCSINGVTVSRLSDLFTKQANAVLSSYIGTNKDDFLMLNAPILDSNANTVIAKPSNVSADNVKTFVKLPTYTESEAMMAPPTEIYVERAVAKVTVGQGSFTKEENNTVNPDLNGKYYMSIESSAGNLYEGDRAYLDSWYLNVTNKSTKIGHDVYGADLTAPVFMTWATYSNSPSSITGSRFFSSNTAANPRRVYWAIDGNYDEVQDLTFEFNSFGQGDVVSEEVKPANDDFFNSPVYCFENTMNYNQMLQKQTTGIVFAMKYIFDGSKEAQTFWMIGDASETYYTEDLDVQVNQKLAGQNFTIMLQDNIESLDGGYYFGNEDMAKLFKKNDQNALSEDELDVLSSVLGTIKMYKNGSTYYYASRIQHFGDYYCEIPNGYVEDVSGYGEEHLGRYGVVRNNWYEIVINRISGPGRPTPPDPTDPTDPDNPDPDDPKDDAFINCRINILSWAKRSQKVDL